MLKLPKIDEQGTPFKLEYKQLLMSKLNNKYIKNNIKDSKFDWIGSQIKLVQTVQNQNILQSLIQFQNSCKQKQILPFHSYFFIKSLLLNKNPSILAKSQHLNLPQKDQSDLNKQQPNPIQQTKPITLDKLQTPQQSLQQFIIKSLKSQQKKILAQVSQFQKIQNFISLRQDIIKDIQDKYKSQSHNSLHQHINDVRFLNLEIFDLIKKWKLHLNDLQVKWLSKQELKNDQYEKVEPIFYYKDQNYLNKVIYDNANMISFMNMKKSMNFITPPNPFFLSQDGNKQSMSQNQKQKIQQAMDFLAKQKAYQLKLLIDPPEYIVKNKFTNRIKSSIKTNQKRKEQNYNSTKISRVRNDFGSLNKLQQKSQISPYQTNYQRERKYSTNLSRDKILSAYKTKTSKLRESVENNLENRGKFQSLIKSKQVQMIKQIRKKKSPPKQFPQISYSKQLTQSKINNQSPIKQKISSLRKQVQKNLVSIPPKQTNKQQVTSVLSLNKFEAVLPISRVQIKTPKPKMKLIVQRQVAISQAPVVNPILNLFTKKNQQNETKQKSAQKQKEMRKSFSTFFKNQEKNLKTIKLNPVNNSKDKKNQDLILSKVFSDKKRGSLDAKHFATTTSFLYKPSSLNKKNNLLHKKINNEPKLKNYETQKVQKYEKPDKNQLKKSKVVFQNYNSIDASLANLKSKIRESEIIKIYGKKMSSPNKKLSQSQVGFVAQRNMSQYNIQKSPYKKSNQKNNYSTLIKKQAAALQFKIEKLLKKQNKGLQGDLSRQLSDQQNNTIFNEFRTIGGGIQSRTGNFNQNLTQQQSIMDQNIQKLNRKRRLIEQSNQIKKKQIQNSKKTKQKTVEQIQLKQRKLKQLQQKISKLKTNRFKKVEQKTSKINEQVIYQQKQKIQSQNSQIHKLMVQKTQFKKQSQKLQQQMIKQQKKFIQLKQQQFKLRQQANKRKYLHELQQLKIKNLQKQKQYQAKILEQQRQRKQNQILLMKQRRQAEQLRLKLQQQQMKQTLLRQILQQQSQRQSKLQEQSSMYQQQIRFKLQKQIHQKQQYQRKVIQNFQQENVRIIRVMQQLREKNRKIQQANKKRIQQVESTMKQKQKQTKLLQELEKQVQQIEQSHVKRKQGEEIQQALKGGIHPKIMEENPTQSQEDIQNLKLRLKEQILRQMLTRRRKQEQQELKFQQQRRKRIQVLQLQIKEFLKKQDQMLRKIDQDEQIQVNHQQSNANLTNSKQQIQNAAKDKQTQHKQYISTNQKINYVKKQLQQQMKQIQTIREQDKYNQKQKQEQRIKQEQKQKLQRQQKQQQVLKEKQIEALRLKQQQRLREEQASKQRQMLKQQQIIKQQQKQRIRQEQRLQQIQKTKIDDKSKQLQKQAQKIHQNHNETIYNANLKNKQNIQNDQNIPTKDQSPTKSINDNEKKIQTQRIQKQPQITIKKQQTEIDNVQRIVQEQRKTSPVKQQSQINRSIQMPSRISSPQKQLKKITHIQQRSVSINNTQIRSASQQQPSIRQNKDQRQDSSMSSSVVGQPTTKLTLKQSVEEVTEKYQNLKQYLNTKTKFLIIQESQIEQYLTGFYSQFSIQVKQMLPYSKQQLQTILKNHKSLNKKIDLYDCNSIGWYDSELKKYTLLGSIQCCHLIQKKYGQVQIQVVYIFNKSNHYQKQYLSKQIKLFQKIGYIYQKKMKQGEVYSIKLIIKIPKQTIPRSFQKPDQSLTFTSLITLNSLSSPQLMNKLNIKSDKHKSIFWYLLSECIRNNYSKEELEKYFQEKNYSIDLNLFVQYMKGIKQETKGYLKGFVDSQQPNTSQMHISFKFPYIQLGPQIYFTLNSNQYTLNNGQKVYLSSNSQTSNQNQNVWKVLVMQINLQPNNTLPQITQNAYQQPNNNSSQTNPSSSPKSYLQTSLYSKIQQINGKIQLSQRQLGVLVPVFKINSSFSISEKQNYKQKISFKTNIKANLISSSISGSNSLVNQQRKIINLSKNHQNHGFIFCICYCPNKKIQTIVAGSWVGYQDIVKHF